MIFSSEAARSKVRTLLILAAAGLVAACGTGAPDTPSYRRPTTESGRVLLEALDQAFDQVSREWPYLRSRLGLPLEEMPEPTLAAARENAAFATSLLASLESIDESELTHPEKLAFWTLEWRLEQQEEALAHHWLGFDITPYASQLPTVHQAFGAQRIATSADAARYLDLVSAYATWIGQIDNRLRAQAKRGILLPKAELALCVPLLESYRAGVGGTLLTVEPERLAALDETEAQEFTQALEERIESEVVPAFDKLLRYLDRRYPKQAGKRVGLWQYPGGTAYYRWLVRNFTTLATTPEEVHEAGLVEMGRIVRGMKRIRHHFGFKGGRMKFAEMARQLPQYRPEDAEDLERRLMEHVELIEAEVPLLFHEKPRAPYGVQRLAPELEAGLTYGYYQPPSAREPRGLYRFNGKDASGRSLLTSRSLMLHELVPGHHFQIASVYENEELHPYLRETMDSAYTEGWAEYAAGLGFEVGLYEDPWEEYGRLAAEAFLVSRLVVDPGMNHLRWSRKEAIAYMASWTIEESDKLETETLRYSVDIPGQALAYKTGSLKIRELRTKAEEALGDDFDVRDFHRSILDAGPLPLTVLERHIDHFIAERTAASG